MVRRCEVRQQLYERMRSDLCVMAEWGDDESALLAEVMTCDEDVLRAYCEIWEMEQ